MDNYIVPVLLTALYTVYTVCSTIIVNRIGNKIYSVLYSNHSVYTDKNEYRLSKYHRLYGKTGVCFCTKNNERKQYSRSALKAGDRSEPIHQRGSATWSSVSSFQSWLFRFSVLRRSPRDLHRVSQNSSVDDGQLGSIGVALTGLYSDHMLLLQPDLGEANQRRSRYFATHFIVPSVIESTLNNAEPEHLISFLDSFL